MILANTGQDARGTGSEKDRQGIPMIKQLSTLQHAPLAADTQIGDLSLTVANLDRSVTFYENVLGFRLVQRSEGRATLGTADDTPLLHLVELPGAPPMPQRSTGLYHFAVLFPTRTD